MVDDKAKMFEATCHCGRVVLTVPRLPDSLTECNCSFCRRIGARWGYFETDDVAVSAKTGVLAIYNWQDRQIDFHHCRVCGCTTHYTTTARSGIRRTAVNGRLFDPDAVADLPVRHFDGAETWRYLD